MDLARARLLLVLILCLGREDGGSVGWVLLLHVRLRARRRGQRPDWRRCILRRGLISSLQMRRRVMLTVRLLILSLILHHWCRSSKVVRPPTRGKAKDVGECFSRRLGQAGMLACLGFGAGRVGVTSWGDSK